MFHNFKTDPTNCDGFQHAFRCSHDLGEVDSICLSLLAHADDVTSLTSYILISCTLWGLHTPVTLEHLKRSGMVLGSSLWKIALFTVIHALLQMCVLVLSLDITGSIYSEVLSVPTWFYALRYKRRMTVSWTAPSLLVLLFGSCSL